MMRRASGSTSDGWPRSRQTGALRKVDTKRTLISAVIVVSGLHRFAFAFIPYSSAGESAHPMKLAAWRASTRQAPHTFISSPQLLFTNAAGADFHLGANDPAIDRADPSASATQDLEQHPRPQGGAPDIGAFERTNAPRAGSRATVDPATGPSVE
jgi:hypothetical protein